MSLAAAGVDDHVAGRRIPVVHAVVTGIGSSVVVVAEPVVNGKFLAYLEVVLSENAPIADVLVAIWQGIRAGARLRNAQQEIGICIACHRSVKVKRAIVIDEAIARSITLVNKAELPYVATSLPVG